MCFKLRLIFSSVILLFIIVNVEANYEEAIVNNQLALQKAMLNVLARMNQLQSINKKLDHLSTRLDNLEVRQELRSENILVLLESYRNSTHDKFMTISDSINDIKTSIEGIDITVSNVHEIVNKSNDLNNVNYKSSDVNDMLNRSNYVNETVNKSNSSIEGENCNLGGVIDQVKKEFV